MTELRLDKIEARALLEHLGKLRGRVEEVVTGCAALDRPLRFGDNWVGAITAERLQDAAAGGTSVLTEFRRALDDLETTVRAAAELYVATDERAAADIRGLGTVQ
jgi:uncharacterized protein YukE